MHNNSKKGPNLGNQGNKKSGSERFLVILRIATGQNLVLFRWTTEAVKNYRDFQSFIKITLNFDQLLSLGLLKIARSQIFDFCLDWPDLAHFLLLLCNNCSKLHNNDPKMSNRGKNEKSGFERFLVILRRATGQNLVLFRWTTEAVKKLLCKNYVFFTYISYIYTSLYIFW